MEKNNTLFKLPKGLKFFVSIDGEECKIGSDWRNLGHLNGDKRVNLVVKTTRKGFLVFSQDRKKNVVPARIEKFGNGGTITKRVPIISGKGAIFNAPCYPQNIISVIDWDAARGSFDLYKVGIISQKGKFFAIATVAQKDAQCYRSARGIVCPKFAWPQLLEMINDELSGKIPPVLGDITSKSKEEEVIFSAARENLYYVKFFDAMQGIGALVDKNNNFVRVHWSSIVGIKDQCPAMLFAGQWVSVGKIVSAQDIQNKLHPNRKTTFQMEAREVKVISQ